MNVAFLSGYNTYENVWNRSLEEFQSKNTNYIKKCFKDCSELNFLQNSHWAHMSISHRSRTRRLEILPCLKYYNALKWKNSLYGWTLPKIPIITKNAKNNNCSEFNFLQKSSGRMCLSAPGVELGGPKDTRFEILWCTETETSPLAPLQAEIRHMHTPTFL